jgi:hypothetical protein
MPQISTFDAVVVGSCENHGSGSAGSLIGFLQLLALPAVSLKWLRCRLLARPGA